VFVFFFPGAKFVVVVVFPWWVVGVRGASRKFKVRSFNTRGWWVGMGLKFALLHVIPHTNRKPCLERKLGPQGGPKVFGVFCSWGVRRPVRSAPISCPWKARDKGPPVIKSQF